MSDHVNGHAPQPAQELPAFDPANPMLAETPTSISAARLRTAAGERLAVTFRTSSTTFTVLFERQFALNLAADLQAEASQMTSLVIPTALGPFGMPGAPR